MQISLNMHMYTPLVARTQLLLATLIYIVQLFTLYGDLGGV